jgi:uncharacterized protein (DUF1330 family)
MTAYVIGEVDISDASWVKEYGARIAPILARHGGKYIARGAPAGKLEGSRALPHVVVVLEFPSLEKATAWYADPDYQPLIRLREPGSKAEIMVVEGS